MKNPSVDKEEDDDVMESIEWVEFLGAVLEEHEIRAKASAQRSLLLIIKGSPR